MLLATNEHDGAGDMAVWALWTSWMTQEWGPFHSGPTLACYDSCADWRLPWPGLGEGFLAEQHCG